MAQQTALWVHWTGVEQQSKNEEKTVERRNRLIALQSLLVGEKAAFLLSSVPPFHPDCSTYNDGSGSGRVIKNCQLAKAGARPTHSNRLGVPIFQNIKPTTCHNINFITRITCTEKANTETNKGKKKQAKEGRRENTKENRVKELTRHVWDPFDQTEPNN